MLSVVVVAALMLKACGSDDSGPDSNLFGTWELSQTVLRDCANPDLNATTDEVCTAQACTRVVINQDNTYSRVVLFAGQEQSTTGTFEVRSDQIRLTEDGSGTVTDFLFVVTATRLTFTSVGVACTQDLVYIK